MTEDDNYKLFGIAPLFNGYAKPISFISTLKFVKIWKLISVVSLTSSLVVGIFVFIDVSNIILVY